MWDHLWDQSSGVVARQEAAAQRGIAAWRTGSNLSRLGEAGFAAAVAEREAAKEAHHTARLCSVWKGRADCRAPNRHARTRRLLAGVGRCRARLPHPKRVHSRRGDIAT